MLEAECEFSLTVLWDTQTLTAEAERKMNAPNVIKGVGECHPGRAQWNTVLAALVLVYCSGYLEEVDAMRQQEGLIAF